MPTPDRSEAADRHDLDAMRRAIDAFRAGDIALGSLVDDVSQRLGALGHRSESWLEDAHAACAGLDTSHALAVDQLTRIPDATDPSVADDLFELGALIQRAWDGLD